MKRKPVGISTNRIGRSTNLVGESGWGQLFASETLVALLKKFLLQPEASFYQRELADAVGTRLYTVQRELARLERSGLIIKEARGNRAYYRANRAHPAFEDLRRVVIKTVGLVETLRAALAPLRGRLRMAFLYGSFASGQEQAGSDIDLFLVGDLSLWEVAAALAPVARELGREMNPTIYPPEELRRKFQEGHHFIREVRKGPKLFLIGSEDDLAALVE
ncbi:MAG: nucleotidyltransferase domain-containing protein [candidate division NC10 bacterium]|nr:nucleotidyltransferase domain-containing protein [candidate division NC10 bacterium]